MMLFINAKNRILVLYNTHHNSKSWDHVRGCMWIMSPSNPPPKKHTFVWPRVCSAAASCQITLTSWALWAGGRLVMTTEKHTPGHEFQQSGRRGSQSLKVELREGAGASVFFPARTKSHIRPKKKTMHGCQGSSLRRKSNTKWNCANQIWRRGFTLLIDLQVWAHPKAKWRHPARLCQFFFKAEMMSRPDMMSLRQEKKKAAASRTAKLWGTCNRIRSSLEKNARLSYGLLSLPG